ncbi:MAG: tRNA lysidine(34) synthetase TilS [Dysgonamonadaceae bacterium]|nr:tRNA lysidine(34) synthetase TilS [Dysgonamonadaceae bacterium]MDD4729260.1 tRNA lysidine(34) synthetase TilS [Dysgonamonadaceae bacterium]
MINKVRQYISNNNLISKESKVIVGLSGGPDSMALLDILINLGYSCIAAHCNFHLRDDASNSDEVFVEKWCSENNIPLFKIDFDTNEHAAKQKISIEMAARNLRYNWFEKLRMEQNAKAVAVGHHKDDSVETILINLIRGTGIKGLTGIPVKNKYIIRPLLAVTRNEIMEYVSSNGISYVVDHTNEEDIYTRNIIRLNVMPILETINPAVKNSIIKTSSNLKEVEKIYDNYINIAIKNVLKGNHIHISSLKSTNSPQSVLFEILSPLGFTSSTIEDISSNLDSIPGKIYLSDDYRILKDRDYLIISDNTSEKMHDKEYLIYSENMEIELPLNLTINTNKYTPEFEIKRSSSILQVDIDKLSFPLILRKWRKGDWFVPFGMKGKKKISDFFTDNKFNLLQKEETWLLVSDDNIVWIVDHRADNRFRITNTTKTVYTLTLTK